jgi:5-methyltetrahydropteroyltriglutamate--homocysteine methyltransferase
MRRRWTAGGAELLEHHPLDVWGLPARSQEGTGALEAMVKRSIERILTTHAGSLARPHDLLVTMRDKEHGRPYDSGAFEQQVRASVAEVVRRQAGAKIDIVSDGEQGKVSFFTYVTERLTGFSSTEGEPVLPSSWRPEIDAFPDYYKQYFKKYASTVSPLRAMVCTAPVKYIGHAAVQADIDNLITALTQVKVEEAFLPSTSPRGFGRNRYYTSEQEYLYAVAEALREEYLEIANAGLILQIDDPWLIDILSDPTATPEERHRTAEQHIEVVNYALRGIPTEKLRMHTCYGLNHGPRIHDLPLREVVSYMLKVNVGAYSFEAANPRHQHEWRIWKDVALPEGKILIPGFLGHATNYVEHSELIADGIVNYATVVGRENVIAGADCGFSSRATFVPEVHPTVVWEKLQSLSDGATLASRRLWP